MPGPNEMHIYVSELNNRIHYLFKHVFNILGIRLTFTNNKESFNCCNAPKLNYSAERISDELFIKPHGLLYEKGIKKVHISEGHYNNLPIIFCNGDESDFPFDIFSAIFYLITRYEEYLPSELDRYSRFQPHESIAHKLNFIEEPIVEKWLGLFKDFLKKRFPDFEYRKFSFNYIPTIDVDMAFSFRNKGFLIGTAVILRDLFQGKIMQLKERLNSMMHLSDDPFDNFEFLRKNIEKSGKNSVFFFLSGKRGKYDKNISLEMKAMKNIVKQVMEYSTIGLHPSYASNYKFSLLENEKAKLESITKDPVTKSRQHFIKIDFPRTYHNLNKLCISEDYSMGYPSVNGFRAGTCMPYNFYDLSKEKETGLKIFPFQAMDATFKTYLKNKPAEAEKKILELYEKVKSVNGTFVMVWHNDTFLPTNEGKDWMQLFVKLLYL